MIFDTLKYSNIENSCDDLPNFYLKFELPANKGLEQGCPTRGPRAACGPLEELVRPFIVLSSFTTARQKE